MSEKSQNKKLTKLTIAARCDKAARSAPNEDNCLVITDLGCSTHSIDVSGREVDLKPTCVDLKNYGCLLVVADGMGGMNAGEIASELATQTIRDYFIGGLENFEPTDSGIQRLLRDAIVAADEVIKWEAEHDESKYGMGTTVALLWIFDNKAYYAWCGDSRIYLYRENNKEGEGRGDKSLKLQSLSLDHSYVMTPAKNSIFGDEGGLGLTEDEAFTHSMNNVIMRSLGNPSEKVNPDVRGPIKIYQGDIFLLCSDGLCGAMRTSTIQGCIEASEDQNVGKILDNIWGGKPEIDWHDNMTTLLCRVSSMSRNTEKRIPVSTETRPNKITATSVKKQPVNKSVIVNGNPKPEKDRSPYTKPIIIAVMVAVVVLFCLGKLLFSKANKKQKDKQPQLYEVTMDDPAGKASVERTLEINRETNQTLPPEESKDIQEEYVPAQSLPTIGIVENQEERGTATVVQPERKPRSVQQVTSAPTQPETASPDNPKTVEEKKSSDLINNAKNKKK